MSYNIPILHWGVFGPQLGMTREERMLPSCRVFLLVSIQLEPSPFQCQRCKGGFLAVLADLNKDKF